MKLFLNILLFISVSVFINAQGLIITSGVHMKFAGSPYLVIRDGGLVNNGMVTPATENTYFTGTLESDLTGSALSLYNIRIENSVGIIDSVGTLNSSNLEIVLGGIFKISPLSRVNVSGTLTNGSGNAGLILESSIDGMASLIANQNAGFTAERYMTGNRWHFVSPTASGETFVDFLAANPAIPANVETRAMTTYDEATGVYLPFFTNSTAGSMSAGESYLLRTSSDDIISFRGTMQSTDASIALTDLTRGWNMIGNPFSSSIMISSDAHATDNFLTYNTSYLDPEYTALYVWNELAGYTNKNRNDFVAVNHASDIDYLQPGQGFMVKSASGGATVYFNANMRSHGAPAFYKKSDSEKTQVILHVFNEKYEAETRFYFISTATAGLDPGYDAGLYGGIEEFNFYSQLVDDMDSKFMIQTLSDYEYNTTTIALGFDCAEASNVTFKAELFSFPNDAKAILEDRELKIFTDLKSPDSEYTVSVPNGTVGTGRFYLHAFDPNTVGFGDEGSFDITFHSSDKEIFIAGEVPENTTLHVFDLMGRAVKIFSIESDSDYSLKVPDLTTGVYILRISDGKMEESQRLFLK